MALGDNDLIYLAPLAALGVWNAVLFAVSRVSGWSALAEIYAADDDFDGRTLRMQSIVMMRGKMPSSYGNIATIGADSYALRLSMPFFFRPFHPPLRIPFSDLSSAAKRVLLGERVELTASRASSVKIVLTRAQAAFIEANAAGALRVPA